MKGNDRVNFLLNTITLHTYEKIKSIQNVLLIHGYKLYQGKKWNRKTHQSNPSKHLESLLDEREKRD